jgi:hypothetical protein
MLRFAADLRGTGEIRSDLSDRDVADIIWTMNAAGYFDLLTQRGWTPDRIGTWLTGAWTQLLLAEARGNATTPPRPRSARRLDTDSARTELAYVTTRGTDPYALKTSLRLANGSRRTTANEPPLGCVTVASGP